MELKTYVLELINRYEGLETQDIVKALYQSEFGCGHLISDREKGLNWLIDEAKTCSLPENGVLPPLAEPLFGPYVRVHLIRLPEIGLSPETLFELFALSAEENAGDMDNFKNTLKELEALIVSKNLPIDPKDAKAFLDKYIESGCPATHHSKAVNEKYHPAYRVIKKKLALYIDVFAAIDRLLAKKEQVNIAIEGGSASGKSTLGELLQKVYDCNLFHMDDYFLQLHQRTLERFAQPGGNVDRERFKEEVLDNLKTGEAFSYRPFDCSTMTVSDPVDVSPKRLNVIEGAYSCHPELFDAYDLAVYLNIDEKTQADRILKRNGFDMQQRFLNEWIPLEKIYFEHFDIRNKCDIVINIE
ncbi:MAG: hypothetical protein E7334_07215 [Clostridiales bacterium]|nr:hypothetical protein [Clostridiales bacterium]